jgi:hypothetical protein
MFTVVGEIDGKREKLTWDDGEVTGTNRATTLYDEVEEDRKQPLYGSTAWPCYLIFVDILFPVSDASGELPTMPPIPAGAED